MNLSSLYTTNNLPYVRVSDTKTSGTTGTTYTSGAFRTVTLNTEEQDVEGLCTVGSNVIQSLSAGNYAARIVGRRPSINGGQGSVRLRNTSDSATLLKWPSFSMQSDAGGVNSSTELTPLIFEGRFSIASAKNISLEIFLSSSGAQYATNDGESEVYWVVELVKLD